MTYVARWGLVILPVIVLALLVTGHAGETAVPIVCWLINLFVYRYGKRRGL